MSQTPEQPPMLAPQSVEVNSKDVTFAEKTERLKALTQFVRSVSPFIWATVLAIVLIPLGGKYLIGQSFDFMQPAASVSRSAPVEATVQSTDWTAVDQAVASSLQTARVAAQDYASVELADWATELEPRVDSFLDWYFDFFHQKSMEFSTPFVWGYASLWQRFNPTAMSGQAAVVERLNDQFQREFAKQVLVPQTAQLRLERITTGTVDHYLNELNQNIGAIQTRYKIPQGTWDRYLEDIAVTVGQEGSISHLSLKTLAGGGTYLAAKPLLAASIAKLSSKASAKVVGAAATKAAAKTGGAVAAELGASVLDPVVGIGIIVWDVWDYRHTVERDRPVLKANVMEYLQEVQQMLLTQPETGVMSAVQQLEQGVLKSLGQ
ncbi:hypothetical protein IQ266_23370 [filamentous cyanobacterium LEGE 11480]|uniref:Uncharacterized protein n=1 Tax=Romeriopsis navalis LEGE 11480 TaxID=2777977 RepID=A0A928VTC8_9CYAN|nr:hypothetical protein [Romeriopsis navalis]MBE9032681.1 hypothetical protein [Romeriopsis navalis LEGE 11480]